MRFAGAGTFFLFLILLGVCFFCWWVYKKRESTLSSFAPGTLAAKLADTLDERKRTFKSLCVCIGVCLVLIAMMRPQWGFQWEESTRRGLDIVIAMDTSKSMLAQDIRPNRLERAKEAVRELIPKLKGDRVGLIAFAGDAFLQCPLTVDYSGFLITLNDLNVNTIPTGGTNIASAIQEATRGLEHGEGQYKVLILITDGEDHGGNVLASAQIAAQMGVRIFCVGIGTPQGELIPVQGKGRRREFVKDERGNVVKSRLDERTLQEIASITGGSYVHSTSTDFGLASLYEDKLSLLKKRDFKARMVKRFTDRFKIPLFLALLLLFGEQFLSERKRYK